MPQMSLLPLAFMTLVTGVAQASNCGHSPHLLIAEATKAGVPSQSCAPQQQTYMTANPKLLPTSVPLQA
jgi:hypothetical protein